MFAAVFIFTSQVFGAEAGGISRIRITSRPYMMLAARLTPPMISNTSPPPFEIWSYNSREEEAWMLLTQDERNFYESDSGIFDDDGNGYERVVIKLDEPKFLTHYIIRNAKLHHAGENTLAGPADWKLYGSYDGEDFDLIDSRGFQMFPIDAVYSPMEYRLGRSGAKYQYYMFEFSRINYGSSLVIGEIELYGTSEIPGLEMPDDLDMAEAVRQLAVLNARIAELSQNLHSELDFIMTFIGTLFGAVIGKAFTDQWRPGV
jgi:hypothetical protein